MASENLYKYNVELTFINGSNTEVIEPKQIKSIVIDYNYDECNMPMIFLVVWISKRLLDRLIKNSNTGLLNFTLYKYVSNNNELSNIRTIRLQDQFVYFIQDDINPNKDLDDQDERIIQQEDAYVKTSIGLMKLDHLKWNKKQTNGIMNNTTMINAVYYCAGHIPMLIEPFTYNKTIDQIIIPPINSVAKTINYLNNISVFYSTPYRFFMDFDAAYLISSAGNPVIKKGEKTACNSVTIEILPSTQKPAVNQGVYIDTEQKLYKINVPSTSVSRTLNKYVEKSYNNIVATTSDTNNSGSTAINVNNSDYMNVKNKVIKLPNNNINMLSNITAQVQNSAVIMTINKNDIDSSIFTINKEYMINCKEVYPGDEGKYLLANKKELYMLEGEDYISNVILTFRKIATK